jgi:hypothetical protein
LYVLARAGGFGELICCMMALDSAHSSPTGHALVVHFSTWRISCSRRPYSCVMLTVTFFCGCFDAAKAEGEALAAVALGDATAEDGPGDDELFVLDSEGFEPLRLSMWLAALLGDLALARRLALLTAEDSGVLSSSSSLPAPRAALAFAASAAWFCAYVRRKPSQKGIEQWSVMPTTHSLAWYLTRPLSCSQCEQPFAPPHDKLCLNTRRTSSHFFTWHTP